MAVGSEPAVVWIPPADAMERTEVGRYLRWLRERRGLELDSYQALW